MAAPTATTTQQHGVAVLIDTRPKFAGYLNIDSPESIKFRDQAALEGEFGQNVTELGNDKTNELTAKLVSLAPTGDDDPVIPELFDTLTESAADPVTSVAARTWLIMEISRPRKAGRELLFECKLKISEGVTLS